MNDLVLGSIIGFVAAAVLLGLALWLTSRRLKARHVEEMRSYDESIMDLRRERNQDKEINRRLRRDLVTNSPGRLMDTAAAAEQERDTAILERNQAVEQLGLAQRDLSLANGRLLDREQKLREYREALQEIRISLEEQDRARDAAVGAATTGDVPAQPVIEGGDREIFVEPPEPADLSSSE